jgi:hypothetical protein
MTYYTSMRYHTDNLYSLPRCGRQGPSDKDWGSLRVFAHTKTNRLDSNPRFLPWPAARATLSERRRELLGWNGLPVDSAAALRASDRVGVPPAGESRLSTAYYISGTLISMCHRLLTFSPAIQATDIEAIKRAMESASLRLVVRCGSPECCARGSCKLPRIPSRSLDLLSRCHLDTPGRARVAEGLREYDGGREGCEPGESPSQIRNFAITWIPISKKDAA